MASSRHAYPQFLLIGDSIIQYASFLSNGGFYFGAGLDEHCSRRLDVVNRGLSGYTTSNILKILPDIIPDPSNSKIDYLLFLCGANDACLPEASSGQHIPLEEYRENIKAIITHPSIKNHTPKILLVTPPPINEVHLESEDGKKGFSLSRTQQTTSRYADAVRDIAKEFQAQNVVVVDLWSALLSEASRLSKSQLEGEGLLGTRERGDNEGLRTLLVDGLHLTGEGYRIFLKEVLPHVGASWAEENPMSPSWILPHWSVAPKKDG